MATTTLTPIQSKKIQNNKDTASALSNNNSWSGFGISLLVNLIITVVVGLVGSNFIYLTRAASESIGKSITLLEFLLPTKEWVYFTNKKVKDET